MIPLGGAFGWTVFGHRIIYTPPSRTAAAEWKTGVVTPLAAADAIARSLARSLGISDDFAVVDRRGRAAAKNG